MKFFIRTLENDAKGQFYNLPLHSICSWHNLEILFMDRFGEVNNECLSDGRFLHTKEIFEECEPMVEIFLPIDALCDIKRYEGESPFSFHDRFMKYLYVILELDRTNESVCIDFFCERLEPGHSTMPQDLKPYSLGFISSGLK